VARKEAMSFDDWIAYVTYKFYNQFAIHAPVFVLDLFVTFLVQNGKYFLVGKVWEKVHSMTHTQ
jgi:hypothetical protein